MGESRYQKDDIHLGIVCPMANEKETAVKFVNAVLDQCQGFKQVSFFTVFDNVCKDGAVDLLREFSKKEPRLKVVWSPENKCLVDAYIRGYQEAVNANCDWILEIDAGFSHNPSEIPQFFDKMLEGYDCVFGSRFCEGGQMSESRLTRKFISGGGTFLVNLLLGTKLKDMTSGFEMFTKSAMQGILENGIQSKGHFFQTEIKVFCRKFRVVEVPIHYRSPSKGVNSKILMDAFSNLFRLFKQRLAGSK